MIVDERARIGCHWERYPNKFLGDIAWIDPDFDVMEFKIDTFGADGALAQAKNRCEKIGVLCAGVTCDDSTCSPRKGRAFMKDSTKEVSYLKLCCRYVRHEGYYLRCSAYWGP